LDLLLLSIMSGFECPNKLPRATSKQIDALCAQGDSLAEQRNYPDALKAYWAAWELLPEPKQDWEAATWILAAVGDANFLGGDFAAGRDNLANAMHCPNAIGNPFLHLRLGQCQFELGELDRAADNLARAYLPEGERIFANDDPKYLQFIKSKLKAPEGGWPEGY
jgi:tetratricopeptide (TPR) repeat protein